MRGNRKASLPLVLLVPTIALATFAIGAQAQTYDYRMAHRFTGAPSDGSTSYAAVRFDAAGNLYGTTAAGGAHNSGTIFKIAKDGTETILHSFDGTTGGSSPGGPVTIDPATGDLYGTANGGEGCEVGCGVLYRFGVDGAFTVLHYFDGINDGISPDGPLLLDKQGNLYGTAIYGAINSQSDYLGNGTVFEYGADGRFTVLHSFTGTDGLNPSGSVIGDSAGNLYGTTLSYYTDGPRARPSIYKLAPDGTLTTLHWFDDGAPMGELLGDEAGNLYGTTSLGGGPAFTDIVFKLAPDGNFSTLHVFNDQRFATGFEPNGGLLLIGGNLYGTTQSGGNPTCFDDLGCGLVFKIAPNGTYTVVHAFAFGEHSANPMGGLTWHNGRLFGTTKGRECPLVMGPRQPACEAEVGSVYSIGIRK